MNESYWIALSNDTVIRNIHTLLWFSKDSVHLFCVANSLNFQGKVDCLLIEFVWSGVFYKFCSSFCSVKGILKLIRVARDKTFIRSTMRLFSYQYSIVTVQSWETKKKRKMFPTPPHLCSGYRTATPRKRPPYRDQSQPGMNVGSHGSCSTRCRSRAWPGDIPDA